MANMNAAHVMSARNSANVEIGMQTEYMMIRSPKVDINGIENTQERKTPSNTIDNDPFAFRSKLVDDGAQEEQMDQRPESS
jgi:hypothetical protein